MFNTSYQSECNKAFFFLDDVNAIVVKADKEMVYFYANGTQVKLALSDFDRLKSAIIDADVFAEVVDADGDTFFLNAHRFLGFSPSDKWKKIHFSDGTNASYRMTISDISEAAKKIKKVRLGKGASL